MPEAQQPPLGEQDAKPSPQPPALFPDNSPPTRPQRPLPARLTKRPARLATRSARYAVIDAEPQAPASTQLVVMRDWQEATGYAITRPTPAVHRQERKQARPWQRKILATLLLVGLGWVGLFLGLRVYQAASWGQRTETPVITALQPAVNSNGAVVAPDEEPVIARAIVKPVRYAQLGFSQGGRLKERLVVEGDWVDAGAALVRLDDTQALVAIAQARAGLQQAEAQLAGLRAGARVQEIAAAQAVVDEAQAQVTMLQAESIQTADETAAQATLAAAQAKLQQLQGGPTEAAVIDVRAAMQQAAATLQTAQSAYNQVSWRNDVAMLPEALQLQQATIAHEAAKARYDQLVAGADQTQLSAAQAEVATARATLARLRTPTKAGTLEAAAARLRQAKAQLALLTAGAPTATLAASEAAVTAAQATLMAAEAALAETVLRAPFAGTVAELRGEVGEQIQPGAPLVQLGDLATWRLETDDLVELDVVKVQAGAPVTITIDALPGVELTGQVVRIKPLGENKVGDMTYTVYIQLDQPQQGLAWNMTATVYIEPHRAVKSS